MQPINLNVSTRLQSQKLENTFYKELEPFKSEGINWNVFIWRLKTKISQKIGSNCLIDKSNLDKT
jgi:hypothetical protein